MKPVSSKRMCRLLEKHGWYLDRVHSCHHVYRHPTSGRSVSVPVLGNGDMKPGTQRNIMRDAGIPADEL